MAVYTHIESEEVAALLESYSIGTLVSLAGIEQGVENSNFHLATSEGRFILTIFEKRTKPEDLPFFAATMAGFSAVGIKAPQPVADMNGATLQTIRAKPALISTFLPGIQNMAPDADASGAFGGLMARMHIAAEKFDIERKNDLGMAGWRRLAADCAARADDCAPGLQRAIAEEIDFLSAQWPTQLPFGVIHADLFPDNVFFEGDSVSGVIDFYFACNDFYAYDLAIGLCAWCWRIDRFLPDNARSMLKGYAAFRTLSAEERLALPILARGAALRFLLTRLFDWINQVEGATVSVKDPLEFQRLLAHLRKTPNFLENLLD